MAQPVFFFGIYYLIRNSHRRLQGQLALTIVSFNMGNRHISPQVKELTLELWMKGFSRSDVCEIFQVSPRSLYRWRKLFDDFGSVTPPPSSLRGRPRIIGLAVMTAIRQLYEHHPDTYLDELQWYLAVHYDMAISISTLQQNLDKAGLT